jgi:hypothetical protein
MPTGDSKQIQDHASGNQFEGEIAIDSKEQIGDLGRSFGARTIYSDLDYSHLQRH